MGMIRCTFAEFLRRRSAINEVSETFPREVFNLTWSQQLERILKTEVLDDEIQRDLASEMKRDIVSYVSVALLRAGFSRWESDSLVSDILTAFLVSPGSLVNKWDRRSPMSARLKVAITNKIRTLIKKQKRSRRFQQLPNDLALRPCQDDIGLITAFRDSLRRQFGDDHVSVFDTRMAGNAIRGLAGENGISFFRLKKIVRDLKEFVKGWGKDDECLQQAIASMEAQESLTLAKRFKRQPPAALPQA